MGYDDLVRITKALSHPVRIQIAELLGEREACVCHLEHALGQRQAYVSQQLGVLKNAGIIHERRHGTFIYYRLRGSEILAVLESLRNAAGLAEIEPQTPQGIETCPCPPCNRDRQVKHENRYPVRSDT